MAVAADALFDFLVQSNGIYGFHLIYFESGGSASASSFREPRDRAKILINDTNAARSSPIALTGVSQPPYVIRSARQRQNAGGHHHSRWHLGTHSRGPPRPVDV
jgi:hypothetical protein